ncbi:MAG: hypothetical protein Q4E99_05335, partial [Bacillota bacterium]|nr:hypothetical protein [Bacillota bacterium]
VDNKVIHEELIYLIEVPFVPIRWDIFQYYKYWAIVTLLTIPGAMICYLVKKQNWLSVAILSVANGYLAYMCSSYIHTLTSSFPKHLLSAIFCLGLAITFALCLLEDEKKKIVALIIIAAILIASLFMLFTAGRGNSITVYLGDGNWRYRIDNATNGEDFVSVEDG